MPEDDKIVDRFARGHLIRLKRKHGEWFFIIARDPGPGRQPDRWLVGSGPYPTEQVAYDQAVLAITELERDARPGE
jgi:hypothetical protein